MPAGASHGDQGAQDALQRQLGVLNAESKEVAAELGKARVALMANPAEPVFLRLVEGLEAKEARLDKMRGDLQAKLPGEDHAAVPPAC